MAGKRTELLMMSVPEQKTKHTMKMESEAATISKRRRRKLNIMKKGGRVSEKKDEMQG